MAKSCGATQPGADRFSYPWELSPNSVRQAMMLMSLSLLFQVPSGLYSGGLLGLQQQTQAAVLLTLFGTLRGIGALIVLSMIAADIRAFFAWQIVVSALQAWTMRRALLRYFLHCGHDRREKTDPVRVRENADFLTLERIKKCPKECV